MPKTVDEKHGVKGLELKGLACNMMCGLGAEI